MEQVTSSSSNLVQTRLMTMIRNVRVSDEQIARNLINYFAANPTAGSSSPYMVYDRKEVPSAAWIIEHNLNKYPQVTLIDDEGNLFEADIFYNSLNQITVVFALPTSGKAVLV